MTNQFDPHEVARDMRAALPPPPPSSNCQKFTEGAQQRWNRAIPEADYIQLGTLRYGVRLSNPNLLNLGAPPNAAHEVNGGSNGVKQHSQTPPTGSTVPPSVGGGASSSGNSSNSVGSNKSCCCIGSGGEIEMPWNSSYARTRLPEVILSTSRSNCSTATLQFN